MLSVFLYFVAVSNNDYKDLPILNLLFVYFSINMIDLLELYIQLVFILILFLFYLPYVEDILRAFFSMAFHVFI